MAFTRIWYCCCLFSFSFSCKEQGTRMFGWSKERSETTYMWIDRLPRCVPRRTAIHKARNLCFPHRKAAQTFWWLEVEKEETTLDLLPYFEAKPPTLLQNTQPLTVTLSHRSRRRPFKKKKCTNLSTPDTYRLQKSHFSIGRGGKRTSIHQKRKKRPSATKNQTAGRRRLQKAKKKKKKKKGSTDLNDELRRRPQAPSRSRSHPYSIERDGKSTPIDERRKEKHPVELVQPAGQRALEKANWRRWNRPRTAANKPCTDLPPNCTDLPPNGLTQLLFVAERRTTHRWKACLLADTKISRSTVWERQGQRKRYSNPALSDFSLSFSAILFYVSTVLRKHAKLIYCTFEVGAPYLKTGYTTIGVSWIRNHSSFHFLFYEERNWNVPKTFQ